MKNYINKFYFKGMIITYKFNRKKGYVRKTTIKEDNQYRDKDKLNEENINLTKCVDESDKVNKNDDKADIKNGVADCGKKDETSSNYKDGDIKNIDGCGKKYETGYDKIDNNGDLQNVINDSGKKYETGGDKMDGSGDLQNVDDDSGKKYETDGDKMDGGGSCKLIELMKEIKNAMNYLKFLVIPKWIKMAIKRNML